MSRSPHGERGLKCREAEAERGARHRRSPHGERGLKCRPARAGSEGPGRRSPHGERGLKFSSGRSMLRVWVAPRTGSVD